MKKFQNALAMVVFSIVLVFGLIGCDQGTERTECDPENGICIWVFVEPEIDYSLPSFYLEGRWAKNDSSEELSINTHAHFWARHRAECPTCRGEVDPPMPSVIFRPFGNSSTNVFYFELKSYDENIITIIFYETEGDNTIGVEVSFSAIVLNDKLTVDGLNLRIFRDGGYVEFNNFNGTYTLMSR